MLLLAGSADVPALTANELTGLLRRIDPRISRAVAEILLADVGVETIDDLELVEAGDLVRLGGVDQALALVTERAARRVAGRDGLAEDEDSPSRIEEIGLSLAIDEYVAGSPSASPYEVPSPLPQPVASVLGYDAHIVFRGSTNISGISSALTDFGAAVIDEWLTDEEESRVVFEQASRFAVEDHHHHRHHDDDGDSGIDIGQLRKAVATASMPQRLRLDRFGPLPRRSRSARILEAAFAELFGSSFKAPLSSTLSPAAATPAAAAAPSPTTSTPASSMPLQLLYRSGMTLSSFEGTTETGRPAYHPHLDVGDDPDSPVRLTMIYYPGVTGQQGWQPGIDGCELRLRLPAADGAAAAVTVDVAPLRNRLVILRANDVQHQVNQCRLLPPGRRRLAITSWASDTPFGV